MARHAESLPALDGNPLLAGYEQAQRAGDADARDPLLRRYSFAVPTDVALQEIVDFSPGGIVELGAGTGYWGRLLFERGCDVVAYDLTPAPDPANRWFAGSPQWFPIERGGEAVVSRHPGRTLLISWPTKDEQWAALAARAFHAAGGQRLAYIGEPPGGRTGDDQLHALFGALQGCLSCDYGVLDVACVCATPTVWTLRSRVELPNWDDCIDDLRLYDAIPVSRRRRRFPVGR